MDDPVAAALASGEWKSHVDKGSGRTYYVNVKTRKTCWDLKKELEKLAKANAARAAPQSVEEKPAATEAKPAEVAKSSTPVNTPSAPVKSSTPVNTPSAPVKSSTPVNTPSAPVKSSTPVNTPSTPPATPAAASTTPVSAARAPTPETKATPSESPVQASTEGAEEKERTQTPQEVDNAEHAQEEDAASKAVEEQQSREQTPTEETVGDEENETGNQVAVVDEGTREAEGNVVDEVVQKLIASAMGPMPFDHAMAAVPTDVLMRMVDSDIAPYRRPTSPNAAIAAPAHPSHTVLALQKRLNEEFRCTAQELRDRFDECIKGLGSQHDSIMEAMREKHIDDMKQLQMAHDGLGMADHAKEGLEVVEDDSLAKEIEALEARIVQQRANSGSIPATTTRLLTFWKTKHAAAVKQLAQQQEALLRARSKLNEFTVSQDLDADELSRSVKFLREKEVREKQRSEMLKRQYLQEAQRLGVTPVQPDVSREAVAQRMLPLTAVAGVEQKREAQETHQASPKKEVASADAFSSLTMRAPQLHTRLGQLLAKKAQAKGLRDSVAELMQKLNGATVQFDQLQDAYCSAVGLTSGSSLQLLEEIVGLRAEIEDLDSGEYLAVVREADLVAQRAADVSSMREMLERQRCQLAEKTEEVRRQQREKAIDIVRVERRIAGGIEITEDDFTDTPSTDASHSLAVLKAKLGVVQLEKHLLVGEAQNINGTVQHLSQDLESRLDAYQPAV